jgi:pteridine reductase
VSQSVALVTGGALRLGKAISQHLAGKGCMVYIHYNESRQPALQLKQQLSDVGLAVDILQGDLRREEDIITMMQTIEERSGRLDMLVNNAATFPRNPLPTIEASTTQDTWQINCLAPLLLIKQAATLLRKGGVDSPGSVVNLIDNCSAERPWANYSNYASSKAGLLAITRSLAVELAPHIRVNAVGPGAILFHHHETEQMQQNILKKIPMNRMGYPDEVAQTVYFLLTGPKYITGQSIHVDGGWSIQ